MSIRSALMNVFSESPFRLVHQHMRQSVKAVHLLHDFFEAVLALRWQDAAAIQQKIAKHESEADALRRQVNRQLHAGMFLPVSRYELLSLVKSQDSIANQSEDIAGYVLGRQMQFPEDMHQALLAYVQSSLDVCDEAYHVTAKLELVMKSGFVGPCMDEVEVMTTKINALERVNDAKQVILRDLLRAHESHLPPVDVMFMYKVLERVGNLADCAHHIGEKFTLMLVSI